MFYDYFFQLYTIDSATSITLDDDSHLPASFIVFGMLSNEFISSELRLLVEILLSLARLFNIQRTINGLCINGCDIDASNLAHGSAS